MSSTPNAACEICGKEVSHEIRCKMCGALICRDCRVEENGYCLSCDEAKCYICEDYLAARACNVCGRLVCEDHGIKQNESTICDECRVSMK